MSLKHLSGVVGLLLAAPPALANACNGGGVDIVGALMWGLVALSVVGTCGAVLLGCFVVGATCTASARQRAATLGLSSCAALAGVALAVNTGNASAFPGLLTLFVLMTIAAAVAALRQWHHRTSQPAQLSLAHLVDFAACAVEARPRDCRS